MRANADQDPADAIDHVGSQPSCWFDTETPVPTQPDSYVHQPHSASSRDVIIGMVKEANFEINRVESLHQWYKEIQDDRSNKASVHHISTQPGVVLLPASSYQAAFYSTIEQLPPSSTKPKHSTTMKNLSLLLLTSLTAVLASPASIPDQFLKKRYDIPPFREDDRCFSDPYGSVVANCDQCSCDEGWKPVEAKNYQVNGEDLFEIWCKMDDGNGGPMWYGPVGHGNTCPDIETEGSPVIEGEENPPSYSLAQNSG
ncbi:MAG: hypothetical protein LQ337_003311 [Flavoplaca oasis]|nr:MAG: hypothetical protein LQ337_003311 [Flavoplaca oasis]